MATVSSPVAASESRPWRGRLVVPEMWAALSICVIWVVVLIVALFGPDVVSNNVNGFTRVPSAVIVVFFAWLATWVIVRHGFGRHQKDGE